MASALWSVHLNTTRLREKGGGLQPYCARHTHLTDESVIHASTPFSEYGGGAAIADLLATWVKPSA